jgi:mannosyl-3-phosphoglycerate phosphatase
MEMTGLSAEEAARASQREYDEPFIILGTDPLADQATLKEMAKRQGCKILKGGRFYHLIGSSNKGRAVRILKRLYRECRGIKKSLGLGDSENDLTLLANVDIPILVQRADGSYDPTILEKLPQVIKAPAPGPEGWALSLTEQLHRL